MFVLFISVHAYLSTRLQLSRHMQLSNSYSYTILTFIHRLFQDRGIFYEH